MKPYEMLLKFSKKNDLFFDNSFIDNSDDFIFCSLVECEDCIIHDECSANDKRFPPAITQEEMKRFKKEYPERII